MGEGGETKNNDAQERKELESNGWEDCIRGQHTGAGLRRTGAGWESSALVPASVAEHWDLVAQLPEKDKQIRDLQRQIEELRAQKASSAVPRK